MYYEERCQLGFTGYNEPDQIESESEEEEQATEERENTDETNIIREEPRTIMSDAALKLNFQKKVRF